MSTLSPVVAELLADLRIAGIEVQADGADIRYRPRSSITPAFSDRIQAQKTELLRILDTETAMAELRLSVERLWKDSAWRSSWERRFQTGRYANFTSLRRVLSLVIDQAEAYHLRRDWLSFVSTCRYLQRLASGEIWDEVERRSVGLSWTLTAWLI